MNKEFKQMSCLLSGLLCLTACGAALTHKEDKPQQNIFVPSPSFPEPTTFTNDITIYEGQNINEIDTDPTVEGTYDIFTITYLVMFFLSELLFILMVKDMWSETVYHQYMMVKTGLISMLKTMKKHLSLVLDMMWKSLSKTIRKR